MEPELLLCDIGNTSIKIGWADNASVLATYSLPTRKEETADSFGLSLLSLMAHGKVNPASFKGCAISSVVPAKDSLVREAITRYVGCPVLFAPCDLEVPLENEYKRPNEVGADRLVGAWAARSIFPAPRSLIIVDYGTAVTFDCVCGQAYLGGLIFPGPLTAMQGLAKHTAKLPTVNLDIGANDPTPGLDTSTSIRHGLVFGFVSVTEGLCARLKSQLEGSIKVIATGGFALSISRLTDIFDALLPSLVLEGLRRLYFEEK